MSTEKINKKTLDFPVGICRIGNMKYKAIFPFSHNMGTVAPVIVWDKLMETKEEEALWHYNKCREHDGLHSLSSLPKGTRFEEIY
jgi:hypothetical protein